MNQHTEHHPTIRYSKRNLDIIAPRRFWPPLKDSQKSPLPRRVSLTIAAGFFFSRGVLLCADSQYTLPGFTKTEGSKILHKSFPFPQGTSTIAFAFSGDVAYAKAAVSQGFEAVSALDATSFSTENVRAAITDSLRMFYEQHLYRHPHYGMSGGPSMEFLIAFRSHLTSQLYLYKSRETVLVELDNFGTVGSGTLLSDYLIPISYKHNKMSLKDVTTLAIYVLFQTKKYVDGCGGSSDFLILHNDGALGLVDYLDVRLGEQFSDFYDSVLRNVFLLASDEKATNDELKKAIDDLFAFVQSHRAIIKDQKASQTSVRKALSGVLG